MCSDMWEVSVGWFGYALSTCVSGSDHCFENVVISVDLCMLVDHKT